MFLTFMKWQRVSLDATPAEKTLKQDVAIIRSTKKLDAIFKK